MLKKLLIGLLALVALLVVIGFLLPDDSHVERSTVINAPACTIYAQLVDFQRFNDWSPWAKLDPETQYTYSGSDWGAGAKMSWASKNRNVGVGSQEIKSAEPYKEVRVVLDFGDQGLAHSFYLLTPEGEGTKVTWGFDTSFEGNLIGRYFGLFMDSMVGASYEEGLANLKTLAEGLPKTDWCDKQIEEVDVEPRIIVSTKGESSTVPEEIGAALGAAYGQIGGFIHENGLTQAGAPLAIAEFWGEGGYRFEAAIPLASDPGLEMAESSAVNVRQMAGARAVRLVHVGPYTGLVDSYLALEAYMAARGMTPSGYSWEEYISDPGSTPEDQLVTHIFMPIGS